MSVRRPPYTRRTHPPPLRLTDRDRHILGTIHAFDGMMSLKQIDRLFFSGKGGSWPRERMRALFDHEYVNMPDADHIHKVPLGETIYFLDAKGAEVVAGLHGESLKGFSWRENPRWSLITHDLAVNDFRIDAMQAAETSPTLTLHCWIPEGAFWSDPDKVSYETRKGTTRNRQMRPDGFFTVRRPALNHPGKFEEFAFLLEIDMSTEDNPRFAREKVRPGVAYLRSQAYRKRFGVRYGRWLVVTTGERRLANMKAQTERAGGSELFYFTTFERVSAETVLAEPIWQPAGTDEPTSVIPETLTAAV